MSEPLDESSASTRGALSRERVLRGAVDVADAGGIGSLTIRSLAQHVGVKPMSLYYYVAGKDEILDGIVDLVFGEIELATLRHHDAVIGTLRGAGFSIEMTAHAYALLDSYTYGFALQESALPFEGPDSATGVAEPMMQQFPVDAYPHLVEMATEYVLRPGYDFGNEFEFGLNLILDALSRSISRSPNEGVAKR